jgi:hypothetical protein
MKIAAVMSSVVIAASSLVFAAPALAADPIPSNKSCTAGPTGKIYACMEVDTRRAPAGKTVTFTGQLTPTAMKNLRSWTKGDNIVCLTRYKPKPEADGSWPWTVLEAACTTVRKNGGFTIEAEFGRKGQFYYGLEMGQCRASADECSAGDSGLIGLGNDKDRSVVAVRTV